MPDNKFHKLYQDFQAAFPLEKLEEMTLDQYTNLNKQDSFCYWIESRTHQLGSFWGGSSYKFGIYRFQKAPVSDDPRITSDDEYAWYSSYGATNRDEAFAIVKSAILST